MERYKEIEGQVFNFRPQSNQRRNWPDVSRLRCAIEFWFAFWLTECFKFCYGFIFVLARTQKANTNGQLDKQTRLLVAWQSCVSVRITLHLRMIDGQTNPLASNPVDWPPTPKLEAAKAPKHPKRHKSVRVIYSIRGSQTKAHRVKPTNAIANGYRNGNGNRQTEPNRTEPNFNSPQGTKMLWKQENPKLLDQTSGQQH